MTTIIANQLSNEHIYLNHEEKNYSLKLPSALLFEFKTEKDAREFNDAVMTLLHSQGGFASVRSSLVSMEASEIYTKELVWPDWGAGNNSPLLILF